jgi:hypothetical protein
MSKNSILPLFISIFGLILSILGLFLSIFGPILSILPPILDFNIEYFALFFISILGCFLLLNAEYF